MSLQARVGLQCHQHCSISIVCSNNRGDKTTFGEHPLVTHFLKGIYELKPSLPRYSVIWDLGTVLKYLQTFAIKTTNRKIGYAIGTYHCSMNPIT